MAIIDILLPKMGESVAEATITKLVVDSGASVEADDPIVEIATDKVDSEVPAPEDGTLVEWCVAEGDVVQVGAVIARYDVGGDGASSDAAPALNREASPSQAVQEEAQPETAPAPEVLTAAMAPSMKRLCERDLREGSIHRWSEALPKRKAFPCLSLSRCQAQVPRAVSPKRTSSPMWQVGELPWMPRVQPLWRQQLLLRPVQRHPLHLCLQ